MTQKVMTVREWGKTPYSRSSARGPEESAQRLLEKYGVEDSQWTQCRGPNGRKAVMVRFNLKGHTYRVAIESLNCPLADQSALLKQAKRAIFWMLKASLEAATVFFSAEEALYAFLELPDGSTMYEVSKDRIKQLNAANFGELVWTPHKALLGN